MHRKVKKTERFNIKIDEQLKAYDEILNDPFSTILEVREIKETESYYGEEGGLTSKVDHIYLVVTYETRKLF